MKKFSDINNSNIESKDLKDLKKIISFSIIGEAKNHPITINVDDKTVDELNNLFNKKHIELLTELKHILISTKNLNAIDNMIKKLNNGDD